MKKILLVDDDHSMIELLKTFLSMEGYRVVTFLDKTQKILSLIKAEKPDFLLMDIHLGDRNGLDIIHTIRKEPELQSLKVIMVSGMELEKECLDAGADAFLLKPYMPNDLILLLQEI